MPSNVRVTPRLSRADFLTGDTLILDLQVQNFSPNPASITASVWTDMPAEPGINQDDFCCFEESRDVVQQADISIPANANLVVRNFFSYQFTGAEPVGGYRVCVRVIQRGRSSRWCDSFSFTP